MRKKIIFILLIITLFSIFLTNVNASAVYTVNDVPNNIINDLRNCGHDYPNHLCLFQKTDGTYVLLGTSIDIVYDGNDLLLTSGYYTLYTADSSFTTFQGVTGGSSSNVRFNSSTFSFLGEFSVVSANYDILNSSTGEPFFPPPLQENLTLEGTIVEMAQTLIIPTVLMMIATAIGLLISLIGLRKGFKMLVNGLKT